MQSLAIQKDLFKANGQPQEEILLMTAANCPVKSFESREAALDWIEKRNQRPGVHPTVRLVRKITQFEELGYVLP
jgi:hypothetical protein